MVENELKVIILGESGVGKTSLISRYYEDSFNQNSPSIFGSTFITKNLEKNNVKYKLNIWDIKGIEKYHSSTKLYIHGADIIILVYAINNVKSFEILEYWYKIIKHNCDENILLAIFGNKYDLLLFNKNKNESFVDDEEAEKYAKHINAIFKLVSAKDDNKSIFDSLLDELLNKYFTENLRETSDNKKERSVEKEEKSDKNEKGVKERNIKKEERSVKLLNQKFIKNEKYFNF